MQEMHILNAKINFVEKKRRKKSLLTRKLNLNT